jgi:hypothetical protein
VSNQPSAATWRLKRSSTKAAVILPGECTPTKGEQKRNVRRYRDYGRGDGAL